ncbi:MAG: hypothetical protein ACXVA9_01920 [Bdellovibrionales bacterium]
MKFGILIFMISAFSLIATAEQSADGKIRQGNGVARATAELAAMDLVQVCLGMPLIQAGAVSFDGIEDLKFTAMPDGSGSTFAYAKCVYKPAPK